MTIISNRLGRALEHHARTMKTAGAPALELETEVDGPVAHVARPSAPTIDRTLARELIPFALVAEVAKRRTIQERLF